MHAVEFETEIVNDTICIPQEYRDSLPNKVRVTITDDFSSHRCRIARTKKKYTVTADDFNSVVIDATKFKFNREEANERR
ncbi:hypothetical protein R80B4_00492 [Fibrobacteres bacterium R8-0-B4]